MDDFYKSDLKEKKYKFYDKNTIGHIEIKNLDCFYFTRYYPINRFGYDESQEFVFNFKSGDYPRVYAQIFSRTILKLFEDLVEKDTEKHIIEDIIILPIPASTREKHKQRFRELFRLISKETGVKDGYEYIKVLNDVEAKHLNNNRTSLDEHIEIDYSFLEEYNYIILIDDVITTGKTISEFANKIRSLEVLKKYGSTKKSYFIIGLTLGKTFNQLDLLIDELENDKIESDSTFKKNSFNSLSELDPLDIYKGIDVFGYISYRIPLYRTVEKNIIETYIEEYDEQHNLVFHTKFTDLEEEEQNEIIKK